MRRQTGDFVSVSRKDTREATNTPFSGSGESCFGKACSFHTSVNFSVCVCVCVVSWLQHSLRGCVVGTLPVAVPVPLFLSLFFIMLAFSSIPSPFLALPCPRPFLLISVCLRCSFSLRALLRHGPPTEEQGRIFHPSISACVSPHLSCSSFFPRFCPPFSSSIFIPAQLPHISQSCVPSSPLILVAALDQSETANALPVDTAFRKHAPLQTEREWRWFAALAIYRKSHPDTVQWKKP